MLGNGSVWMHANSLARGCDLFCSTNRWKNEGLDIIGKGMRQRSTSIYPRIGFYGHGRNWFKSAEGGIKLPGGTKVMDEELGIGLGCNDTRYTLCRPRWGGMLPMGVHGDS